MTQEAYLHWITDMPLHKSVEITEDAGELLAVFSDEVSRTIDRFPVLFNGEGEIVQEAVMYFFDRKLRKNLKSLSSTATALLFYCRFLEINNFDWFTFGTTPSTRPTYVFRDTLQAAVDGGTLAASTAKSYMNVVVSFYKWALYEGVFEYDQRRAPFRCESLTHNLKSDTMATKKIVVDSTDLRIVGGKKQGGRVLRPLTLSDLRLLGDYLVRANEETQLMVQLSLFTGMRITEVATYTEKLVDAKLSGGNEVWIGLSTGGNETKGNKDRPIEMPDWLNNKLLDYRSSEKHKKRRALFEASDAFDGGNIPLFITQKGLGFGQSAAYKGFRRVVDLIRAETSNPFEYSFHDLRSTYATHRLSELLETMNSGSALSVLQRWMGHEDVKTLMDYLDFVNGNDAARYIAEARDRELEIALLGEGHAKN